MAEDAPAYRREEDPYLDENGEPVKPEAPNGYKFESLVLDMIHQMDSCLPFEVVRRKEFAPIKNKTGVDSVESARTAHREWCSAVNISTDFHNIKVIEESINYSNLIL